VGRQVSAGDDNRIVRPVKAGRRCAGGGRLKPVAGVPAAAGFPTAGVAAAVNANSHSQRNNNPPIRTKTSGRAARRNDTTISCLLSIIGNAYPENCEKDAGSTYPFSPSGNLTGF
jgi:hypothetical protein